MRDRRLTRERIGILCAAALLCAPGATPMHPGTGSQAVSESLHSPGVVPLSVVDAAPDTPPGDGQPFSVPGNGVVTTAALELFRNELRSRGSELASPARPS